MEGWNSVAVDSPETSEPREGRVLQSAIDIAQSVINGANTFAAGPKEDLEIAIAKGIGVVTEEQLDQARQVLLQLPEAETCNVEKRVRTFLEGGDWEHALEWVNVQVKQIGAYEREGAIGSDQAEHMRDRMLLLLGEAAALRSKGPA